ncbi:MAG: SusC/RagA family TonB-linked outer membrane protein [Prevotellaceae bacterium]|jgi:TonB-linked SusC/RagA family outer membrane protein|nr:SusC/RagA family TonB-linked outer membrane protein [Prevotellaceae bacterium]
MKNKHTYFIVPVAAALLWATPAAAALVSGMVANENGEGIPGVSVIAVGASAGAITDGSGRYTINVPDGTTKLAFSSLEYSRVEREITGSELNVTLTVESHDLDEVVVTALGIARSQKSIGYAASTVSSSDITSTRAANAMSALAGKVAGVQISSSSTDPGASTSVIIRGISSINGNNQPLYVVDGVPLDNTSTNADASAGGDPLGAAYDFGNGASMINPDDIASMTILKGAAATALYGSRAANGVIVITTRSGAKGEGLNVELNTGMQLASVLRLPDFQNEFGMGYGGSHALNENTSWGPRFDGRQHPWGVAFNGVTREKPFVASPNNIRDFFETGMCFQNSLSVSGGSEKTSYYASFSQASDNGIIPTRADSYDKYTFAARGSHEVKILKVSSSLNYSTQSNKLEPTGQGLTIINSIYQTPRDVSIVGLKDLNDPFNTPEYYYTPYGVTNPYYLLSTVESKFDQKRINGKVQVDVALLKKLTLTYRLGMDATDNEMKRGFPKISPAPGTPNAGQINKPGSVYMETLRRYEVNHEAFATYSDSFFSDMLELNVLAGWNANERSASALTAQVAGLNIPTHYDLKNSASMPTVSEAKAVRRLVGVFASVELAYNGLLFLNLTARNDNSSTLPQANSSFFYPGATLSYLFSENLSAEARRVMNFGKLRVAYGRTGNDASPYMVKPYYLQTSAYNEFGDLSLPMNGVNGYTLGDRMGNPSLRPEISTEYEAGANVGFFDSRITMDVAGYYRVSDGQILALAIDPATGYRAQNSNLGKISNRGVEALLSLTPVKGRNFLWTITANFSKNSSRVESLPKDLGGEIRVAGFGSTSTSVDMVVREGSPVGEFKVTVPKRAPDGRVVVNHITGLPLASPVLGYVGKVNFDFEGGLSSTVKFRGLSLSADFDVRQGGLMYSRTKSITYFTGNAMQTTYNGRNPFVLANSVNEVTDKNGVVTGYVENTTPVTIGDMGQYFGDGEDKLAEHNLIPRSYAKLRNVSISYDLPESWIRATPLKGVRLSVFGSNLLLWTPAKNTFIDPEVTSFGNDFRSYLGEYSANPTTRRYGFNLMVRF